MTWWINIIMGFLIGSFAASYSERYRSIFIGILSSLAKKKDKAKKGKKK